jgi:hypothetical protein
MIMDILVFSIASLAAGAVPLIWRLLRENSRLRGILEKLEHDQTFVKILDIFGVKLPKPEESYEVRMDKLIRKFSEVSTESDQIIFELETNLRNKKAVVDDLGKQQNEIAEKIEELRQSPEFGNLLIQAKLDKMEADQKKDSRKGALRDYLLFAGGVITPFIIGAIAKYFNIGIPTP